MADNVPIDFPAGYATAVALGFASDSGKLSLVEATRPLPVSLAQGAVPPALSGNASGSVEVGPYIPAPGHAVMLQLTGQWQGDVTLLRSTDGGATRVPVTAGGEAWGVFTANACEAIWIEHESAAGLYLAFELAQGSANYRVSQ